MISEHAHMPGAIYALSEEDSHVSGKWQTFQHSYMPNDSTLIDSTPYIRGDRVLELLTAISRASKDSMDCTDLSLAILAADDWDAITDLAEKMIGLDK
jgi:hypothetical protein